MSNQEVIEELRERITRLEASKPRRRRVYNLTEAAAELNMSVAKLRKAQKAGRIKATQNGRIWIYTDAAIEEYLASEGSA